MARTMFNQLWTSIADGGRELLRARLGGRRRTVEVLCRELLSVRGEASGAALAREILETIRGLPASERLDFLHLLGREFGVERARILDAARAYEAASDLPRLEVLRRATETSRLELFRRMNFAPGGTRGLLRLREELLAHLDDHPALAEVDADLRSLLGSWFNPGFLSFTRIDWSSPAALLEKFVRYEKVHRVPSLEALKRRLAADRRCFAFFHPALPDEPLIFVQVALVDGLADAIEPLIDPGGAQSDPSTADTAIFYSISNCQDGLRGITLGSFLLKAVIADLQIEFPEVRTYATLSPIPGFAAWLAAERQNPSSRVLGTAERDTLASLDEGGWEHDEGRAERLRPILLRLCAFYLVRAKVGRRPRDPVARFHLGNGARLERLNWLADRSEKGLEQSLGMLVNYRYDPAAIERNHETFVAGGEVIFSSAIKSSLPAAIVD